MEKLFETILNEGSVEEDLAAIEAGGFEAFRDEKYDDPGKAADIHAKAQDMGMSDLDYINRDTTLEELEDEDPLIAAIEEDPEHDCMDLFIDEDLNDIHRPLKDQFEELKKDGEVQDRGWDIMNILRDGLDQDAYDITDGRSMFFSDLMGRLEKYKDDERTPACRALYQVFVKIKQELEELDKEYYGE